MKKVILPGLLVLYGVIAGLGLFLRPNPSGLVLPLWLTGYMIIALAAAYSSYFSKGPFDSFPFIVLGIIQLNFFVQITGGSRSTLWPAYFVFATVVAVFSTQWQKTLNTTCLILAIEASNLFVSGQWEPAHVPVYAGFALSLVVMPTLISHSMHRTRGEKEQVENKLERLIEHADAINPLADNDTIGALTEENRLASNIKAARSLEDAFDGLIDMIYSFVPAHAYALFLRERVGETHGFVLRARRSDADGLSLAPIGEVLKPEKDNGIISGCTKYTQPQYLSNIEQAVGTLGYYTRSMPVRSIFAIPIVQSGDTIGVLVVDSLEGGAFSLETQDMLARFAPFFIQIIEKIRVSQELDLRAKNFGALHDLSAVLNSTLELNDILARLAKEINVLVPYDFCVFVQYNEKDRTIDIAHQSGSVTFSALDRTLFGKIASAVRSLGDSGDRREDDKPVALEQGTLINQMLNQWKQGQSTPYHFSDLGERKVIGLLDTTTGLSHQLRTLSCWPLVTRDKFIGAFFLGSLRSAAFSEFQRTFLDTLMNQVALVMDNAILHRRISDMAHTDGLTGLLNHRTFMDKLDEEFKRLDRDYQDFSLLILDIDFFKKVNDEHGHPVGDVALKTISGVIHEMSRSVDFVARYGGEEFAVGMVGADTEGARVMAERIRKSVENTVITAGKITLQRTLSIGIASYYRGCDKKTLISQADQALYHAKQSGRNRVSLYKDIKGREAAPTS